MTEISHKSFAKNLAAVKPVNFSPVYLIFGDPYLCRKSCQTLLDALVPGKKEQSRCVETAEHIDQAQVADLLEQLNTYSFFATRQIVVLRNASVFTTSRNREEQVKKIKTAYDANELENAAKLFLRLLGQAHLGIEDAGPKIFAEKFSLEAGRHQGLDWVSSLADYCLNQGLSIPRVSDETSLLLHAIDKGFPKNHHLIITAETVDKRTGLYKAIKAGGTIIDCSVAKGARKKDRDEQKQVIHEQASELLDAAGKKMAARALEEMYLLVGFDLHSFSRGIEKLIAYTGERKVIEIADVRAVLTKSREAPIYELTGAISDKNGVAALRLLKELLDSGYHYLQILMAITNQLRRLLLVKGFVSTSYGSRWQPRMPYEQFKNIVMPAIQEYDKKLVEQINGWSAEAGGAAADPKKKVSTELIIARQPNNPYPVYQQFLKAANFSEDELRAAFKRLHEADLTLKTSGRVPDFVLQQTIIAICGSTQSNT